jgi:hypothetical protein
MTISEATVVPLERYRHGLAEMCEEGDRNSVRWGRSEAEHEQAKTIFDGYIARGWSVFRLTEDGEQGRRMEEFDPTARGMLAIPQMVGG